MRLIRPLDPIRPHNDEIGRRHGKHCGHFLRHLPLHCIESGNGGMIILIKSRSDLADDKGHQKTIGISRDFGKIRAKIGNENLERILVCFRLPQIKFPLHPNHSLYFRLIAVVDELRIDAAEIFDKLPILYSRGRINGIGRKTIRPQRTRIPVPVTLISARRCVQQRRIARR